MKDQNIIIFADWKRLDELAEQIVNANHEEQRSWMMVNASDDSLAAVGSTDYLDAEEAQKYFDNEI